jgi:hypothetical protein
MSFPALLKAFTAQGAFAYYAAWCMVGWVAVLLFLPETKLVMVLSSVFYTMIADVLA